MAYIYQAAILNIETYFPKPNHATFVFHINQHIRLSPCFFAKLFKQDLL